MNEQDAKFIKEIRQALREHGSLKDACEAIGCDYHTAYGRVRRLGYRFVTTTDIQPIHPIQTDEAA